MSKLRFVSDCGFKHWMVQILILTASRHAEVLKKLNMKELETLGKDECTVDYIDRN